MPFTRGNPGRPRGSRNKVNAAFRLSVITVYHAIGGDSAFAEWGRENRTEFYKIAARLIPQELALTTDVAPLVIDLVTSEDVAQMRRDGIGE